MRLTFTAELWEHGGEGSWYFLSVPEDLSEQVREETAGAGRGFGSLRVRATVEGVSWTTSVFPSKSGSYLLPVKKAVRRDADLVVGDHVEVQLEVLEG